MALFLPRLLVLVALLLTPVPSSTFSQPHFGCDSSNPRTIKLPFCNKELSLRERARDLVSRLTLDEKVLQLVNSAAGIPRLGVPAYEWWSEALHGVSNAGKGITMPGKIPAATNFPQVILTASSFDSRLWFRIAQVIGKEARAVYNAGQASGMTFWAPNINIFRDPRWGRGQETPGEDPLVVGRYSVSYVRGLQGDSFYGSSNHSSILQASACCKHFTAYDLDRWHNTTRYAFDALVSAQDMADTFQPPFERCVREGKASGIMCAYNRVNGVPNCADHNLLTETARGRWGFNGYITSDCDAVSIIYENQGYAKTPEDAVADVLRAGMDVNCGSYLQTHTKSAIEQKKVAVTEVDRALVNLFTVRMRLGLFDGDPSKLQFGKIGPAQVCTKQHQELALEAALNGIVLLKNNARLLPFAQPKAQTISLAVIGPNANSVNTLLGNYHGPPCKSVSPLQALQGYVHDLKYHPGCATVACPSAFISEAVAVARAVDHVVLLMGLDQSQEREDYDRQDLVLPGKQQSLIEAVAKAAKKPVVLVLLCGGPVDVSFAKYDRNVGSIIWAGYPGEAGGTALAQILFGDHNPGGRLPITWYPRSFARRVPMTDMRMRSNLATGYPGRTYRFYQGKKVFEFGYGLSYSSYIYNFVSVSPDTFQLSSLGATTTVMVAEDSSDPIQQYRFASISELLQNESCEKMKFTATIGVKNKGDMGGKHPLLLYVRPANSKPGERALKKLIGFKSISLQSGETAQIEFELSACEHLSRANREGLMILEEGANFLLIGDQEYPISVVV